MDGVLEAAGYTPGAVRSPPLSTRTALGPPLEHIFSHVRHTMHVEACDLSSHVDARSPSGAGRADEDGSEGASWESGGRSYCWMSADEMTRVGVTAGVKKVTLRPRPCPEPGPEPGLKPREPGLPKPQTAQHQYQQVIISRHASLAYPSPRRPSTIPAGKGTGSGLVTQR